MPLGDLHRGPDRTWFETPNDPKSYRIALASCLDNINVVHNKNLLFINIISFRSNSTYHLVIVMASNTINLV